jgi:predicted anti-sigma-YlaC factor YlaD
MTMDCGRGLELLSDYLDGSIGDSDRVWVDAHMAECLECLVVFRDLEVIVHVTITLREDENIPYPNEDLLWERIELRRSGL